MYGFGVSIVITIGSFTAQCTHTQDKNDDNHVAVINDDDIDNDNDDGDGNDDDNGDGDDVLTRVGCVRSA